MLSPEIYLSPPSVIFGEKLLTNDMVIGKVTENFRGDPDELRRILTGIKFVFRSSGTSHRYLGLKNGLSPVDYAVETAEKCCNENGVPVHELDLLIYGGIYREYLEPSTAMEIASKLGIRKIHAFDVTSACAGMLQAVNTARALMQSDQRIKTALCCTTDFPDNYINYNIQSFSELETKAAGLTLGSGAASWLLSRKPLKNGGAALRVSRNTSLPESFNICKVPLNDKFTSQNKEIFNLGLKNIPREVREIVNDSGWNISDVDYFLSHQPSKKIISQLCRILDIHPDKSVNIHDLFGNTVNVTVPMAFDYLVKNRQLQTGDKIVMSTAAAGFTMVSLTAQWEI